MPFNERKQKAKYKTKEAKGLDQSVSEAKSDRSTTQEELDAIMQYLGKLDNICIAKAGPEHAPQVLSWDSASAFWVFIQALVPKFTCVGLLRWSFQSLQFPLKSLFNNLHVLFAQTLVLQITSTGVFPLTLLRVFRALGYFLILIITKLRNKWYRHIKINSPLIGQRWDHTERCCAIKTRWSLKHMPVLVQSAYFVG